MLAVCILALTCDMLTFLLVMTRQTRQTQNDVEFHVLQWSAVECRLGIG